MIIQGANIFSILAEIIGIVFGFLAPFLVPIGEFMVDLIEIILPFFDDSNLTIYIIIFIVLIIAGAIVNSIWPGDKPKQGEKIKKEEKIKPKENLGSEDKIEP